MKKLLVLMLLIFMAGCATPDYLLRESSKTMHDTVHKEYLKYVEEDESLLPEQKTIRKNRVKAYGEVLYESTTK